MLADVATRDDLALPAQPFPRRPSEAWRFVTDHVKGSRQARRLIIDEQVSLVVGLGSYASVAMVRAAQPRGVPTVLLEQNAVPGRANRWLASRATLVCTAMAEANLMFPPTCRTLTTGNPLRRAFTHLSEVRRSGEQPYDTGPPRLLVLGGSGGAQTLNEHVPAAIYKAGDALRGWEIIHQTGQRDQEATAELYRKFAVPARVEPFIDGLAQMLLGTTLVIGRAGGTTLAELTAAGVPAILIPYPNATDDHQRKNADVLTAVGGAIVVDQREIATRLDDRLAAEVTRLAGDTLLRQRMSAALLRRAKPDAAADVARIVLDLVPAMGLVAV